jgi:hypothetical protein
VVGALALSASPSAAASAVRASLLERVTEVPIQKALVGPEHRGGAGAEIDQGDVLVGEMSWAPGSALKTTLLALTGILFLRAAGALLARYTLGLRRPARLRLTGEGLELAYRVDLLGKTLRERASVVPFERIAELSREVRFARAGTYAGLLALVLGTYFGVTLLSDGVRAPGGSPTLVGLGLGVVALGLLLDFALTSLLDGARRKVRLVVVPDRGRRLCIAGLDAGAADDVLRRLAAPSST